MKKSSTHLVEDVADEGVDLGRLYGETELAELRKAHLIDAENGDVAQDGVHSHVCAQDARRVVPIEVLDEFLSYTLITDFHTFKHESNLQQRLLFEAAIDDLLNENIIGAGIRLGDIPEHLQAMCVDRMSHRVVGLDDSLTSCDHVLFIRLPFTHRRPQSGNVLKCNESTRGNETVRWRPHWSI